MFVCIIKFAFIFCNFFPYSSVSLCIRSLLSAFLVFAYFVVAFFDIVCIVGCYRNERTNKQTDKVNEIVDGRKIKMKIPREGNFAIKIYVVKIKHKTLKAEFSIFLYIQYTCTIRSSTRASAYSVLYMYFIFDVFAHCLCCRDSLRMRKQS